MFSNDEKKPWTTKTDVPQWGNLPSQLAGLLELLPSPNDVISWKTPSRNPIDFKKTSNWWNWVRSEPTEKKGFGLSCNRSGRHGRRRGRSDHFLTNRSFSKKPSATWFAVKSLYLLSFCFLKKMTEKVANHKNQEGSQTTSPYIWFKKNTNWDVYKHEHSMRRWTASSYSFHTSARPCTQFVLEFSMTTHKRMHRRSVETRKCFQNKPPRPRPF